MDHSLGESQNYHRPTQDELLQDYLQAVDFLTINDENKLKKKILELTERQDEIDLMKLKHDKEMKKVEEEMKERVSNLENEVHKFVSIFSQADKKTLNQFAKQALKNGLYVK